MLTTAKVWTADEAAALGMVNTVVDDDAFENALGALIADLSRTSASAIMLTKTLLYHMDGMTFDQA
jgi:methylglutaconyl-CoA hydratase